MCGKIIDKLLLICVIIIVSHVLRAVDRVDMLGEGGAVLASNAQERVKQFLKDMPASVSNAVYSSGKLSFDNEGRIILMTTNLRNKVEAFLVDADRMSDDSERRMCLRASIFADYFQENIQSLVEFEGGTIANYGNIQDCVRRWLGEDLYERARQRFSDWFSCKNSELRGESVRLLVQGLGDASRMTEFRSRFDDLNGVTPESHSYAERLAYAEGLAYLRDSYGVEALREAMNNTQISRNLMERAARAAIFLGQAEDVAKSKLMAGDAVVPALRIFDAFPTEAWKKPSVCRLAFDWLLKVGAKDSGYTLEEGILMSSLASKSYPDRDALRRILGEDTINKLIALAKRFGQKRDVRLNMICGDVSFVAYEPAEIDQWLQIAQSMVDDFPLAQILCAMYDYSSSADLTRHRDELSRFLEGHKKMVRGRALALIEKSMGIDYVPIRNEETFKRRVADIKRKLGLN